MKFKKIHFIINPAAGNDEPILSWINDTFSTTKIKWEVSVTKKKHDAKKFTLLAVKQKVDCIAIYGGDGTVAEVAQVLSKTSTPLAIIPGGTANILAKELGIPIDAQTAIANLKRNCTVKQIDVGVCNGETFVLRINAGVLADMVKKTNVQSKEAIGQFAYAVTALKELGKTKAVTYELTLDGKKRTTKGIALVVANSGNIGIPDISLMPGVLISDGFLDVLVFKTNRFTSFVSWITHIITKNKSKGDVRHWQARQLSITMSPKQSLLLDDVPFTADTLTVSIVPNALAVVVPKV